MRGQARRSKGISRELKEGDCAYVKRPYFAQYVSLVRIQQGEPQTINPNLKPIGERLGFVVYFGILNK